MWRVTSEPLFPRYTLSIPPFQSRLIKKSTAFSFPQLITLEHCECLAGKVFSEMKMWNCRREERKENCNHRRWRECKTLKSLFASISIFLLCTSVMIFLSSFVLQYFIIKNVFPLSLSFGNIWLLFLSSPRQQCSRSRVYLLLSHEISFHERNKQFLWWNRRSCTMEAQTYVHIILITKQTMTTSSGLTIALKPFQRTMWAQQSTLLTQHVTIYHCLWFRPNFVSSFSPENSFLKKIEGRNWNFV